MNAKELHTLYAPLWALVPETRPTNHEYALSLHEAEDVEDHDMFWWQNQNSLVPSMWAYAPRVDHVSAAALCRVAVEDWLIATSGFDRVPFMRSTLAGHTVGHVLNTGRALCVVSAMACPTIHHALVAAALAVAKTRKER